MGLRLEREPWLKVEELVDSCEAEWGMGSPKEERARIQPSGKGNYYPSSNISVKRAHHQRSAIILCSLKSEGSRVQF